LLKKLRGEGKQSLVSHGAYDLQRRKKKEGEADTLIRHDRVLKNREGEGALQGRGGMVQKANFPPFLKRGLLGGRATSRVVASR